MGSLTITTIAERSRTIEPIDADLIAVKYNLQMHYKSNSNVQPITKDFTDSSVTIDGLVAGTWEVSITAYNEDGIMILSSQPRDIEIKQNVNAKETFILEYLNGNGFLDIEVSIPSSMDEVAKLKINLIALDEENADKSFVINREDARIENNLLIFSDTDTTSGYELPVGIYDIEIRLLDNNNAQIGITYLETLHVYANLVSPFVLTWSNSFLPRVTSPTIALSSGSTDNTVLEGSTVKIECSDPNATIYYTIDGSTPNKNSSIYSSPITLNKNCTISAIAAKTGLRDSQVVRENYLVKVKAPILTTGGTFLTVQTVTASVETKGASIYYTLGETPLTEENWTLFPTDGLLIENNTKVNAIAIKDNLVNSDTASQNYIINNQSIELEIVNPTRNKLSLNLSKELQRENFIIYGEGSIVATLLNEDPNAVYSWYVNGTKALYNNGTEATGPTFSIGQSENAFLIKDEGGYYISCKVDSNGKRYNITVPLTVTAPEYKIGDRGPAGGFVFYDAGDYSQGWRYMEYAPKSINNVKVLTDQVIAKAKEGSSSGIGKGKYNSLLNPTISMISVALNYSVNDYDDWYLPSNKEMFVVLKHAETNSAVNVILEGDSNKYFSSEIDFSDGVASRLFAPYKNITYSFVIRSNSSLTQNVWPIRYF